MQTRAPQAQKSARHRDPGSPNKADALEECCGTCRSVCGAHFPGRRPASDSKAKHRAFMTREGGHRVVPSFPVCALEPIRRVGRNVITLSFEMMKQASLARMPDSPALV